MASYIYRVAPIDYGWHLLKTVQETLAEIVDSPQDVPFGPDEGLDPSRVSEFLQKWEQAKSAAFEIGWEGDFLQGPNVFWVPTEDGLECGFVFKQSNNGTTYIVSPVELPWLS